MHGIGQEIMDLALEPPQEAQQFICRGEASYCSTGKRGCGICAQLPQYYRQLVNIFDHAHSEAQAQFRLQQLRQDIQALADHQLNKIPQFFDDHWDQAMRYLRKKGMGTQRRRSNSESGMRLLRRLEKNHDGIRSPATRQHYIQIYQAMKYLSCDIADFIEKGPQLVEFPGV